MTLQEFHRDIMQRPYEFHVLDNLTGEWTFQDNAPRLDELQTYQPTKDPHTRVLAQTKECYLDTRYAAKMRLYTYTRKKYGLAVTPYRPFEGTDIGINTPILNF